MRKRITHALSIFLIAIALLPAIEGILFKYHYLHLIDIINKDNRLKIKLLEYKQGWFHSRAKIFITPNPGLVKLYQISVSRSSNRPIGFTIDEQISHGPFIYDRFENIIELGYAKIQNDIYLPKQIETKVFGTLKTQGILRVDLLSEFNGNWSGKVSIPPVSLTILNFGELTWLGLKGKFNIELADTHVKHTSFEAAIGSTTIEGDPKNAYIKRLTMDPSKYIYNVTLDNAGLFSGFTNSYTRAFSITKPNDSTITGNHFAVHTAFNMDQATFYAGNVSINIKNLKISDPSFGLPTISVFHSMILANNFNIKNLHDYVNTLKMDSPEDLNNVDIKTLEGLLIHSVTPDSNFRGEISLDSSLGSLNCNYKSSLRTDIPAPNTFNDLIASANTKAQFVISPSVAYKIVELYNDWISISTTPQGRVAQIKNPKTTHASAITPATPNQSTTPTSPQQVSTTQTPPKPLTPQEVVNELLLGGYLFKDDNNNYVTELSIASGVWQLNGKTIYSN